MSWPAIKLFLRTYGIYIATGVAIVVAAILFLLLKRKPAGAPQDAGLGHVVEAAKAVMQVQLERANIEAATEIATATGKEEAVKEEVAQIRTIDNDEERLRRLSDLVNRTRRR